MMPVLLGFVICIDSVAKVVDRAILSWTSCTFSPNAYKVGPKLLIPTAEDRKSVV